jgi:hypothetical protein
MCPLVVPTGIPDDLVSLQAQIVRGSTKQEEITNVEADEI